MGVFDEIWLFLRRLLFVTGVHRLVEVVVTLRISAAPDGIRQINDVSPRQGSLANLL
jgi:hypothetical protein